MSNGQKAPPALDFEIPDLDVAPSRRGGPAQPQPAIKAPAASGPERSGVRSAARPAPQAPPAKANPQDYFGSGNFDADHFGGGSVALELDTDDGPPRSGRIRPVARPAPRARPKARSNPGGPGASRAPVPATPAETEIFDDAIASEVSSYFGADSVEDSGLGSDFDGGFDHGFEEGLAGPLSQPAGLESAAPARAGVRVRWPTGISPLASDLAVDPADVQSLSRYGAPPAFPLLAPLYTYHVFVRRAELRRQVDVLAKRLTATEQARDEQLASLVRDSWSLLEEREDTRELLDAIAAGERHVAEQQQALAGKSAEFDLAVKSLAHQIAGVEEQISAAEREEAGRAEVLEGKQLVLRRVEAKKQRIYIEIRTIVDAAEKTGGTITAEQSARVKQLEAHVAAMKPELDAASHEVAVARQAAEEVRSQLRTLRRTKETLQKETRELSQRFEKQIGTFTSELDRANRARLDAYAEVGRRVLELKGRIPVDEATLEALRGADSRVAAAATELERHAQAFQAFDPDAYRKGFVIVGVLAALMLVVILFFALR